MVARAAIRAAPTILTCILSTPAPGPMPADRGRADAVRHLRSTRARCHRARDAGVRPLAVPASPDRLLASLGTAARDSPLPLRRHRWTPSASTPGTSPAASSSADRPPGIGTAALASLLNPRLFAARRTRHASPHFAPKAKRVIYLFMSGGPSHIDLLDYKPKLKDHHGQELARLGPQRPADHGHDLGPEVVPVRRADVQASSSTASAAPGSASFCRTSAGSPTTSPSSRA